VDQTDKARRLAALHVRGDPLVLFNIWDAGSAKAVAEGGAKAIATGSWSVAAAQGYADGEAVPLDLLVRIVQRIVETVDLPVTVDFEGGYATEPGEVADNVERIISAGAVGINFEDGIVGQDAVFGIPVQCRRIDAVRRRADRLGLPLFINARTDLFLISESTDRHSELVDEAIERARAYADAGASGFFAPGLADNGLIEALCAATTRPVNIMVANGVPPVRDLATLGVSRVSHGPLPYVRCMGWLRENAAAAMLQD